jgi:hypothetical protein
MNPPDKRTIDGRARRVIPHAAKLIQRQCKCRGSSEAIDFRIRDCKRSTTSTAFRFVDSAIHRFIDPSIHRSIDRFRAINQFCEWFERA